MFRRQNILKYIAERIACMQINELIDYKTDYEQ